MVSAASPPPMPWTQTGLPPNTEKGAGGGGKRSCPDIAPLSTPALAEGRGEGSSSGMTCPSRLSPAPYPWLLHQPAGRLLPSHLRAPGEAAGMGAVEGLLLLLLLLLGGVAPLKSAASWHALHYFEMAVWQRGRRIPHFTSLAYVDDHLIGRYDRSTHQYVPQSSWIEEIRRDDADFWARSTGWDFGSNLVMDLMILKNLYNQSRGTHTLQEHSGCEVSGEGGTHRGFVRYGYNGRDFLSLDLATLTWTAMSAEAKPVKKKWDAECDRGKTWEHFLTSCVEWLRTHLRYGEAALLRTDPPTGRVACKAGSDGLETLVCQLHGFYPKEIDVTWRKDGEDQKPETLTGGVIPNSDGTYHTWLSIVVDPEDRGRYRCHVEHDGLPEPLDLAWEEPAPESKVGLTVGAVLGAVAALALVGSRVTFHIKKQRGGSYQGAPRAVGTDPAVTSDTVLPDSDSSVAPRASPIRVGVGPWLRSRAAAWWAGGFRFSPRWGLQPAEGKTFTPNQFSGRNDSHPEP